MPLPLLLWKAVVEEGTENRTVGATLMNATSSRAAPSKMMSKLSCHEAHTVLTIEFKQVSQARSETVRGLWSLVCFSQAAGQQGQKLSLINLVDLAGSEKVM